MNTIHIFEKPIDTIDGKEFDIRPGDKVIIKDKVFMLQNVKGTSKNLVRIKIPRSLAWALGRRDCVNIHIAYMP